MKTKISVTAQGTILKQPVSTAFTYESSSTFTGYSGEVVVEKGIDIKALFLYLSGNGAAGEITNGKRTVLKVQGWTNKTTQEQISIIEGIISDITLRIINFEKIVERGEDEQKSSIFSVVLPKLTIDSIPGLPLSGFKPLEMTFEVMSASKKAEITAPDGKKLMIPKGFSFILTVNIPGVFKQTLSYPPKASSSGEIIPRGVQARGIQAREVVAKPKKPAVKWFDLNKKWGPVNLKRMGLKMESRERKVTNPKTGVEEKKKYNFISLFFDTDFNFSKLQILVRGLKLGLEPAWPLKKPEFGLSGLGILLDTKPITIGGLLVKQKDNPKKPDIKDNYLGAIIVRVGKLNIFGVGAYAKYKGKSSILAYAYLGIPVEGGGPFTLQGIALGFGYNRDVVLPKIENVGTFPLVTQAMGNVAPTDDGEGFLGRLITDLTTAFPPKENNIFIAVGIKFNSYKVIDGFVLVFLVFGDKFKLQVLGLGTLSLMEGMKEPLIFIELALRLIFVPADGIFALDGLLTSRSYILSKDAKLTGGFAMYFWFGDNPYAGDFVITFGGYHKKFTVPAHYPKTPRVALNWVVSNKLSIKAEAYFALTPVAIMAGGMMSAVFDSSILYASFKFYADFLMQWKPVYYDIHVGIDIHIRITVKVGKGWFSVQKTVSFDLEIELHIWGPEFSGYGRIKFKVLGVKFSVGLEFGSNSSTPPPLSWSEFKSSFLPANLEDKLSLTVSRGLIKIDKNIHVINPRALELRFESGIPVSEIKAISTTQSSDKKIGAFPTNYRAIESVLSIDTGTLPQDKIKIEYIKNSFPKAIWGNNHKIDTSSGKTLITDVLSGVKITLNPTEPAKKEFKTSGFDGNEINKKNTSNYFDYEDMLQGYDDELIDNSNHVDIYRNEFLRAKPTLFFTE